MKKQILSVFFTLFVCCFNQLTWADEVHELFVGDVINSEYFYNSGATVVSETYDVGGKTYTQCVKMSSTTTTLSGVSDPAKVIQYDARTTETEVEFVVVNKSTTNERIFYYTVIEDGNTACVPEEFAMAKSSKESWVSVSKTCKSESNNHRSFYFSVSNADARILSIKITEKGTPLPMAGEAGYAIGFNQSRLLAKANTPAMLDKMTIVVNDAYKVLSTTPYISIKTATTQYIHFYAPEKVKLTVSFDGNQTEGNAYLFYVAQSLDAHTNETSPKKNTSYDFFLSKGNWYIFSSGNNIKVAALAFTEMEDIDPPTNYSISNDGEITFDQLQDCSYKFEMLDGNDVVISQENVESGTTITRPFLKGGNFTTKLYAIKQGVPSDAAEATWTLSDASTPQENLPESEYCGFPVGTGNEQIGMTWETDADGNINIYAVGVGAQWRGTAFNGVANFKVANLSASLYFDEQYTKGSNVYTLKLKSGKTVALGEKITFNDNIQWQINGTGNYYKKYELSYTYGANCPESGLDTPTDLAITDDVLTFTGDEDATSYTAKIYYNGNMVDFLPVVPEGTTLPAPILTSMTYQVKVIAFGDGGAQSDESEPIDWTTTDRSKQKSELSGSEYCDYVFGDENKRAKMDWQTETANGNINIDIKDMDGTNTTWRDDAFKGIENFTVGKIPASEFFDIEYTKGSTCYQLKKKTGVTLGWGETITFKGTLQWKMDGQGNCYKENQTYTYTYGTGCANLDAPTNFAITTEGVVTFVGVDGAEGYLVRVYDGENLKLEKPITSGETLVMYSFVDKTFDVCVVAYHGTVRSDESNKEEWTLTSAYLSQPSEYCERIVTSGTNSVVFDWQTNEEGSVVITISEGDGGESGTTYFRQDGMSNQALSKFTVGESKQPAGNYFERVYTTGGQVYTLQLKENVQLAPGTKIYQSGNVEYVSQSEGDNAYHNFGFEYTYGTRCIGIQVSADVNDATMGSAVVKQNGEEVSVVEEGAVQFIATPTNEHYQFVNWTQNGVEVSPAATYEMTPTATTRLVANFIYVRYVYCHTPIYDDNNAKSIYLTLGTTGKENEYEIKFEGTPSYHLTGVNDANFAGRDGSGVTNNTETDPVVEPNVLNKPKWNVDTETDYGVISIKFTAEDYTKIDFSSHYLPMATSNGEFIMDKNFPIGYAVDWTNSCVDVEAPVLDNPSAEALNSTDVRLTLKATDNRDGVLTYTISRADMEDIIIKRASGETVTQDILGLPSPATYEFSVVVSDGAGNTCEAKTCSVTLSASDTEAPTNVLVVATPVSDQIVELTLSADDNYDGDITYVISYGEGGSASTSAERGTTTTYQITGFTANTEYTFSVVASDAAGNQAEAVKATTTTFSGNLALKKVSIAGDAEGNHTADKANDGDVETYWGTYGKDHATANVWTVNLGMVYDIKSVIMTTNNMQGGTRSIMVMGSIDGNTWSEVVAARDYTEKMTGFATGLEDKQARYLRVVGPTNGMISISEFEAYGTPAVDTEDPVITSFTADGVSATSVIVKATATDNFLGDLTYQFHCEGMTDPNTITEVAGTEVNYIFEGLTTGVEYKFTVTVTDQRGNSVTSDQIITTPIADDETAPSIPEVSNVVALFNTVSFVVVSTDDKGGNITYVVKDGDTQVATTSALSATPVQITIDNLIPNTTYTLTITASDASDNTSEVADVLFTTEGPAPSSSVRTAGMVRAIYTDVYDVNHYLAHDFVKVNFGGASYTEETIDGDKHMRYYPAASGQDIVWGNNGDGDNAIIAIDKYNDGTNKGLDVRNMEYLHVDIWSKTAINFDIKLNDKTIGYANHTGSGWEQFDLPLMEVAEESKTNVRWMKFNNGKNLVCLDNVYFYTTTPVIVDQMDIADPAPIWMAFDGEAMDVTLNRAFEADGFNYTLCLPFDLPEDQMQEAFGADYKLWKLDDAYMKSAEVLYLDFKEVRDLEAGVPYIFLPTQNFIAGGTFSGVTIKNELYPVEIEVPSFGSVSMTGIYSPYTLPVENNYVLGDDNWLYQSDGGQMYGLRCYFTFGSGVQQNVRARAIFNRSDVVTDLEPIHRFTDSPIKVIKDGHLYIIRNGKQYNALGF